MIGWLVVLNAATSTEVIDAQNALVTEADALAAKKLYVRAIPKYTEALSYKTENNAAIQAKLLEAYLGYNQGERYTKLVEARLKNGTATETEILNAADIYLNSNSLDDALLLLEGGIELLGSEALIEKYEDNRYVYQVRLANWEQIFPTQTNTMMLAKGSDGWTFVDEKGKPLTNMMYQFATVPNSGGYAVVKETDTFLLITSDGSLYGIDETGLEDVKGINRNHVIGKKDGKWSYYNPDFIAIAPNMQFDDITVNYGGYACVKSGEKWYVISDNGAINEECSYDDIAINSYGAVFVGGAGMVKSGDLWYLVAPDGTKIIEQGFANAKAPESSDGLIAVANDSGMWGYINSVGELVIDYQYEDAKSFSYHLGAVNTGENWGYISERGELVIDEPLNDAQPFQGGYAPCTLAGDTVILELELFEN